MFVWNLQVRLIRFKLYGCQLCSCQWIGSKLSWVGPDFQGHPVALNWKIWFLSPRKHLLLSSSIYRFIRPLTQRVVGAPPMIVLSQILEYTRNGTYNALILCLLTSLSLVLPTYCHENTLILRKVQIRHFTFMFHCVLLLLVLVLWGKGQHRISKKACLVNVFKVCDNRERGYFVMVRFMLMSRQICPAELKKTPLLVYLIINER